MRVVLEELCQARGDAVLQQRAMEIAVFVIGPHGLGKSELAEQEEGFARLGGYGPDTHAPYLPQ